MFEFDTMNSEHFLFWLYLKKTAYQFEIKVADTHFERHTFAITHFEKSICSRIIRYTYCN